MLDAELLEVLNQIPGAIEKAFTAFIERHPGHGDQKAHGRRGGVEGHFSEDVVKNIPKTGKLGEMAEASLKRMEEIDTAREASDSPLKNFDSNKLLQAKDAYSRQISQLSEYKRQNPDSWQESNEKQLNDWKDRRTAASAEIESRKEWYSHAKRVTAAAESERTGKIVVDREMTTDLLGKTKDVYREGGVKTEGGRYPYNPDMFKTSDLSGKKVRNYIDLPSGLIAHPDEIHEARKRGRLIVVDQIPVQARDWTK